MNRARPLVTSSWTWLAIALLLVGLLSLVGVGGESAPPPLDAGSARPDGALALRLWLQRLGYQLTVSTDRLNPSSLATSGTLALLAAGSDIPKGDDAALVRWLSAGGHLVVATDGGTGGALLDRLNIAVSGISAQPVRVLQPILLAPAVARLSGSASAVISGRPADVEVAGAVAGSVLLLRRLGRGTLWVLSAPDLLDNAHIARADNRRLALNLVGPRGTTVTFDQFRPPAAGTPAAAGDWLTSTSWGVALLLFIAILILYRWLAGVRLGPSVTPLRLQYRPAAEYVLSLAGLLRRARRREEVLAIYQTSLLRLIQRRYGDLEGAPLGSHSDDVRRLLLPVSSLSESELVRRAAAVIAEEERVGRGSSVVRGGSPIRGTEEPR